MDIPGYRDVTPIHEGTDCHVFRAHWEQGDRSVVLKLLDKAYPQPRDLFRYRKEYEILSLLAGSAHTVKAFALEELGNNLMLVLEDMGGVSLRALIAEHKTFALAEVLDIAIQVADSLREIHAANVIHKDINPSNILLNPRTGQVKIIDFGIATVFSCEAPSPKHPKVLQGTMDYLSPEQTGRMNRSVDFRTDFYSLGATLYELLTRRTPFLVSDSMELVHCHMARVPESPSQLVPEIPAVVSQIVLRLLAKNPEERYQSAEGLGVDLDRCRKQLAEKGRIEPFPLGSQDFSARLIIPQRLYGREAEIDRLQAGFARVCQGSKQMLLVSGPSGVGKTALVIEVYKPLTRTRGTIVAGRFDQLKRDTPYTALVAAFRVLAQQLLAEPEEPLARWRDQLLSALGSNGRVLLDLLPEFELILGPQPELPELSSAEQQNRFNAVLQDFVAVFTTPAQPLVMFLDDLQWADSSSLKLIQLLMTSPRIQSLYLIGAFRDNEVDPTHPLVGLLKALEEQGVGLAHLPLGALSSAHVAQMLVDTLRQGSEQIAQLAELLHQKTEGNPFFLKEFLNTLVQEGALVADRRQGCFTWSLKEIREKAMTVNVAELMAARIRRESAEVLAVLQIASCLGNPVDLETLCAVTGQTAHQAVLLIQPAIRSGFVVPIGEAYDLVLHDPRVSLDGLGLGIQFAHDRIRQAVYDMLSAPDRLPIHRQVGELLRQKHPPERDDSRLFDMVHHLNEALFVLGSQQERDELAGFNLLAGTKAKASAALGAAAEYLTQGLELLGREGWRRQYDLALALHDQAAEIAYLNADFERMDECTRLVLENARQLLDKVKAHTLRIEAMAARHQPQQAIQEGLALLRLLGVRLPENPSKAMLGLALLRTRLSLATRSIEGLVELPAMTDPSMLAAVHIMRKLAIPAFVNNMRLMALLLFTQVRLTTKLGHTPWSASMFGSFGIVLCGVLGDVKTGHGIGRLALQLVEKRGVKTQRCRVNYVTNAFILHWKQPLQETLQPFLEGCQSGLEHGDHEYAAFCAHMFCHHGFYLGKDLALLSAEMTQYTALIERLDQRIPLSFNRIFHQAVLNLINGEGDPCLLKGEAFDEEAELGSLESSNNRTAIFAVNFLKMVLCFLFQRPTEGLCFADESARYLDGVVSLFGVTRHAFFDGMLRISLWPSVSKAEQKAILRRVSGQLARLKKWSRHAPANHLHLYHLLSAERLRVLGKHERAGENYDLAVELARQNRFVNDEALASERAAEYHDQRGNTLRLESHAQDARHAYLRWGAKAKVQDLDHRYGFLLKAKSAREGGRRTQTVTQSVSRSGTQTGTLPSSTAEPLPTQTATGLLTQLTSTKPASATGQGAFEMMFDLGSVFKASQTISGEIELSKLLDKLMKIVLENAGADRGFLILKEAETWTVEASIILDQGDQTQITSTPLEQFAALSPAVVYYVGHRKDSLILNDERGMADFFRDISPAAHNPKCILAVPLMRHGVLVGVLYLENNHVRDAFTPTRVEVLTMLASQVAISLDNARLYQRLHEALELAEESERAKAEFYAKTTHELRTPLNAIINLPQGLLANLRLLTLLTCDRCGRRFEFDPEDRSESIQSCPACQAVGSLGKAEELHYQGDPGEVLSCLQLTVAAGQDLLQVVNNLLDISALQTGRMQLALTRFPVGEVLGEAVAGVLGAAAPRGIRIAQELEDPAAIIVADRQRVRQILRLLLENAIRFSPPDGQVFARVRAHARDLCFEVEDQGIGIEPQFHELIFQGFRQVDGGTTRRYGGVGLGLAICKRLAELHGGTIQVKSGPGRGSQFTVRLPREPAADSAGAGATPLAPGT